MDQRRCAFLFGAGASFGSGGVIAPHPPPLGGSLLTALRVSFANSWGKLPEGPFSGPGGFEEGMAQLIKELAPPMQQLLEDFALYFCQFTITHHDSNKYRAIWRFLQALSLRHRTLLCTLNYECLLEQMMDSFFYVLEGDVDRLDEGPGIRILKLHGSCNLLQDFGDLRGVSLINPTTALTAQEPGTRGLTWRYPPSEVVKRHNQGYNIFPFMRLYAPEKPVLIAHGDRAFTSVPKYWADWMARTDLLLIVGARPWLSDHHVWDPILSSSAKVLYVGGTDGDFPELKARLGDRLQAGGEFFDKSVPAIFEALSAFSAQ